MSAPRFPGVTAVSHLRVYDWPTPDGVHGGTPHVHTASTEAYVVTSGEGEVHTIAEAGVSVAPLTAGSLLWFGPGTVHRLVNVDRLELVVVMQNSGLPEAGDAVLTFPREILADPEAYAAAVRLPQEASEEGLAGAARTRRDLALRGYAELVSAIDARGPAALEEFHRLAVRLVEPHVARWREIWEQGVERETARTRDQLASLGRGERGIMGEAAVVRPEPHPGPRRFGMCGRLRTWRVNGPE
ncbi:cupin domain-containing protein [Nocardiopsis sp. MG754419]|uniref:cupin domain-containing protein n=1 Tax=Nocardiopsis sp. MG754419 TaxID=2259865 RepID=UPI001BABEC90|nr:cupin domain-containing protein [Nocardiopsis sp. MG754419]MBR8740128.1 cupin [Nocardiopsis sp. MG754419]